MSFVTIYKIAGSEHTRYALFIHELSPFKIEQGDLTLFNDLMVKIDHIGRLDKVPAILLKHSQSVSKAVIKVQSAIRS